MRKGIWIAVALIVVALAAWESLGRVVPGQAGPAPGFAATSLDGQPVDLASYKGKAVVLLNFFQTTCAPCMMEYPQLQELQARYGSKGFQVISIAVGEPAEQAGELARRTGTTFPVVPDPDRKIATPYGVDSIPHNVIVGKTGNIQSVIVGYDASSLEAAVRRGVESS